MQAERWQRIKEVLDVSLQLEPGEREAYLARVCEGDAELREEVDSLIAAHEQAGDLFETPPLGDLQLPDPLIGARLGPYEIVEQVGSGGMGTVYRAVRADEAFRKDVAIKVVRRGLDLDRVVRHFRVERQIMASLEHPHIASLLDGGATPEGLPYFVMEFIRGEPIDTYCDQHHFGIRERLEIFRKVCDAVEFAHQKGVVHRDIKPSNILVTHTGVPKLLDFGVAKILNPELAPRESFVTIGPAMTPDYASPEQLKGEPVSPASDVFSLGIVLCELLSGSRPYAPRTPFRHVTTREVDDPKLPSRMAGRRDLAGDLDSIVVMAVQEDPVSRYQSAGLLGEDLRRHLEGMPVVARRQGLIYRLSKFVRRQRAAVVSVGVTLAVAAMAFLILTVRQRLSEPAAPMQIVPITSRPGAEVQPALSPDGEKVAYVWKGENGEHSDIYVQPVAGGQPQRLTSDPDDDTSPAWSPDGSQIAWLRSNSREAAIFVAPPSGGAARKLASVFPNRVDAVGRHLDWSPDGKLLAVTDKGALDQPFRIVLIDVRNGSKREATLPPEQLIGDVSPAFSPDGKWVAFLRAVSSGVNDIYIAPAGGGPAQRVTFDDRYIVSLAWTPDANAVVFSSERGGNAALWQAPVSGGTPIRIPLVGQNASDPAFSRDGRRFVYSQFFSDANIWRREPAGQSPPKKLISSTQYDSGPQYSPDGKHIAFRSNRSGNHEIWVCDSEGENARQLTQFNGPLTGTPRWSPDGRQIVFDSRPEGQAEIYAIPVEGGAPRRITNDRAEDVAPSWSKDGHWIYFASNRSGAWQVWRAPAERNGRPEAVTILGGFAALESPDGNYLYFAKGRDVAGLWRKRWKDGVEEPVIEDLPAGYWGYWAVTKDSIDYVTPEGLFSYDLDARKSARIAALDRPAAVTDSAFAASADGRFVLYTQIDQSGSDILMLDNYRR